MINLSDYEVTVILHAWLGKLNIYWSICDLSLMNSVHGPEP